MGSLPRTLALAILLISIYGWGEGNAKGSDGKDKDKKTSDEDAAELEEVNKIMFIRFNAGKPPFENMNEYMKKNAKELAEKANPGAEIDEESEEFLKAYEEVKIFIATATGPNYAKLFTRPGTAEKFKDMFEKYDHLREYKSEL